MVTTAPVKGSVCSLTGVTIAIDVSNNAISLGDAVPLRIFSGIALTTPHAFDGVSCACAIVSESVAERVIVCNNWRCSRACAVLASRMLCKSFSAASSASMRMACSCFRWSATRAPICPGSACVAPARRAACDPRSG